MRPSTYAVKPKCTKCQRPLSRQAFKRGEWAYNDDGTVAAHTRPCEKLSLKQIKAAA